MDKIDLKFKTELIIPEDFYNKCLSTEYNMNDLEQITQNIYSENPLDKLQGLIGLRKLSIIKNLNLEPILLFKDTNILFDILQNYPEEFKYECLVSLAFIECYNSKNDFPINMPPETVIKIILHILEFSNKFKQEMIIADLNYIEYLVDDTVCIEKLGLQNLYKNIKRLIEKEFSDNTTIIASCLHILHYFFNDKQIGKNENNILEIISLMNDMMNKYETNKVIFNSSLKVIYRITNNKVELKSESANQIMQKILDLNLPKKLIDKIDKLDILEDEVQILYSIRIIGNLVAMDDNYYTDEILKLNIFEILKLLIKEKYSLDIRKEAAWIISNIAAGTNEQLNALYNNNFQDILFDIILNGNEDSVKNNCLWALYNFSNIKNQEYINILVERGFIDIIINRLKIDEGDIVSCSFEALDNLLSKGKNLDPANFNIIESKVNELDILKELKNFLIINHPDEACMKKVKYILSNYFGIKDIDKFLNEEDAIKD